MQPILDFQNKWNTNVAELKRHKGIQDYGLRFQHSSQHTEEVDESKIIMTWKSDDLNPSTNWWPRTIRTLLSSVLRKLTQTSDKPKTQHIKKESSEITQTKKSAIQGRLKGNIFYGKNAYNHLKEECFTAT